MGKGRDWAKSDNKTERNKVIKMRKIKVSATVYSEEGPRKVEVDGFATKSLFLAVHGTLGSGDRPIDGLWTVTHIPTGLSVRQGLGVRQKANDLARDLAPYIGESARFEDYEPVTFQTMQNIRNKYQ